MSGFEDSKQSFRTFYTSSSLKNDIWLNYWIFLSTSSTCLINGDAVPIKATNKKFKNWN